MQAAHRGIGTLGIVTQVTLKLKPLPEERGVVVVRCQPADLAVLLDRVHESKTRPVCVDVCSQSSERKLLVGFEDNREAVAWQIATIQSELGVSRMTVHSGGDAEREWPTAVNPANRLAFKANLLSSALPRFLERLSDFPEIGWQAHAGNGIVIGHTDADWPLEQAVKTITVLRETAIAAQGNLIVTRCPPEWKKQLNIWAHRVATWR